MQRRRLVQMAMGAAAVSAWPFGRNARAQQAAPLRVGFLHSASQTYFAQFSGAVRKGLAEAGFAEGQNLKIDYRWAEGHYERLPALAAELVERRVAAILAMGGTDPARAAKAATSTIPIVFVSAADPVQTGLVASLSRPGGNVTGVSLIASALDAKKLGLLHELVPGAKIVAGLTNPKYPDAKTQADEMRDTAKALGLASVVLNATRDEEIDAAFAEAKQRGAGAMLVASDPFFNSRVGHFVAAAARNAVPVIYPQREYVRAGGLMSYGPDYSDGYRNAGVYVGRILKGASPAELPVVQPTKFELVVNMTTARALGLAVPPTLLATADEVIE